MRFFCILLGVAVCFLGCRQSAQTEKIDCEKVVYQGPTISTLADIALSAELLPLRHEGKYYLGNPTQIIAGDSSFYIKDKTILRFDQRGKFLNKIGTVGHGPQEYMSVVSMSVDNVCDEVWVQSGPVSVLKLYYYRKNGEWKGSREANIPVYNAVKSDTSWWVYKREDARKPSCQKLYRLGPDLQIRDSFMGEHSSFPMLSVNGIFSVYQDRIHAGFLNENRVYTILGDSVYRSFDFDFGSAGIPEEFYASTDPLSAFQKLVGQTHLTIDKIWESKDYWFVRFDRNRPEPGEGNRLYGFKHKKTGKWDWIDSAEVAEQYGNKMKGFDKEGRLMCFVFGYELENLPKADKALIRNPEVMENMVPDQDMFILFYTLK